MTGPKVWNSLSGMAVVPATMATARDADLDGALNKGSQQIF